MQAPLDKIEYLAATPLLASLDMVRSVDFYVRHLGAVQTYLEPGVYAVVQCGAVALHFWACEDVRIAQATACRVQVRNIEALYTRCQAAGIVHPKAALATQAWGEREFGVLDPDGNLLTFHEPQ